MIIDNDARSRAKRFPLAIWACFFATLAGLCLGGCFQDSGQTSESVRSNPVDATLDQGIDRTLESPNWAVTRVGPDNRVRRVILRTFHYEGLSCDPEIAFRYETTDESVLRKVEAGLEAMMVRADPGEGVAISGALPYAQLDIETSKDRIVVALVEGSFVMGSATPTNRNIFWSWTLASMAEDLFRKATIEGLSRERREGLSGEALLRRQARRYDADE